MQKFLIGLITSLLEKYVLKWFRMLNEMRKDRKLAKEIKNEKDAKTRAQRLTDHINK